MTIVALFGTLAAAHPLLGPIVVIAALPTLALKMARTPGTHAIDVRGVSFTYPGSSRPALRNVSFSIRPGEKVALVGENGSGKTTLVQLLFGLLPPSHGEILYDGRDVPRTGGGVPVAPGDGGFSRLRPVSPDRPGQRRLRQRATPPRR